jgi:hypothetical protein
MLTEDDLRAALHTLDRHTPDPERMLSAIRASGHSAAPERRPGNWPRRLAPLAAAAAVVAVVAASILVAKVYAPGPMGGGRAHRVSTVAPPFPTWDGVPAYFAEVSAVLHGSQPPSSRLGYVPIPQVTRSHMIELIATSTGRVAATVRLPGYVGALSASAGAFFAAAVHGSVTRFYEIRLADGGARATVTELPVPPVTAPLGFIAASPDGSKLAISTFVLRHPPAGNIQNLIVAATATGAERRWRTPPWDAQGSMGTMNWLANGKALAFTWTGAAQVSPSSALRLLDTAAPGHDLLSGTAVLRLVNQAGSFDDYTISPDGDAVFGIVSCLPGCSPGSPGTVRGHRDVLGSLIQFAAATGSARVRYTEPELPGLAGPSLNSTCTDPLWISDSGRTVLLPCYQHQPAALGRKAVTMIRVVLLAGGRVTRLPRLTAPGYGIVAFSGMPEEGGLPAFPVNP